MTENYDLLILFSGGADSSLLLEMAKQMNKKTYCLLIDYGQHHIKELSCASEYLNKKSTPFSIIKITGLDINSGLTGNGVKGTYEGVSSYNVPGRNTIFLSLAFSFAEANKIDEVWYGPDMSDFIGKFPDCYQSYVAKMSELYKIAGSREIRLLAPLLGYTKELVLETLNKVYKIKQEDIYSGYGEFA